MERTVVQCAGDNGVDENRSLREHLDRFRSSLDTVPPTADELADLLKLADLWRSAILGSLGAHAQASPAGISAPPSVFLGIVRERYEAGFKAAYGRVLVRAKEANLIDHVLGPLRDVQSGLQELDRWAQTNVLQIARAQVRSGGNPILVLNSGIRDAIAELETLRPILSPPTLSVPLSEECEQVWRVLDRKALTAKQIASRLGLSPRDDSVIRKRIKAIRLAGLDITTSRTRGYFRPDAPPPTPR